MDLAMPHMDGMSAIRELKRRSSEIRILVLTMHKTEEHVRAALQAGIDRCIDSYPETPEPGAWWMPAHRGGGAITAEEQGERDERERESYRTTG